MDIANKGYLNYKDLRRISDRIGNEMTDKEIEEIMNNCSLSNDEERVYFEDFYKVMTTKF